MLCLWGNQCPDTREGALYQWKVLESSNQMFLRSIAPVTALVQGRTNWSLFLKKIIEETGASSNLVNQPIIVVGSMVLNLLLFPFSLAWVIPYRDIQILYEMNILLLYDFTPIKRCLVDRSFSTYKSVFISNSFQETICILNKNIPDWKSVTWYKNSTVSFWPKCPNKTNNLPTLIFTSKIVPNTVIFLVQYPTLHFIRSF